MKSLDNSTCLLHFVTRVIFIKPVFIWIMHIYPTRIKTETAVIKSQLQWHWCFFKYIKKTLHVVTCSCCTRWSDHTLGLPKSINIKLNCVNKETDRGQLHFTFFSNVYYVDTENIKGLKNFQILWPQCDKSRINYIYSPAWNSGIVNITDII